MPLEMSLGDQTEMISTYELKRCTDFKIDDTEQVSLCKSFFISVANDIDAFRLSFLDLLIRKKVPFFLAKTIVKFSSPVTIMRFGRKNYNENFKVPFRQIYSHNFFDCIEGCVLSIVATVFMNIMRKRGEI